MALCVTSTFSEPEDFAAALRPQGIRRLLVTESGPFQAELRQVSLHLQHLVVAEERKARIAFITVPAGAVLISFVLDTASEAIWGGIRVRRDQIAILGSGESLHVRTEGLCRWAAICLPGEILARYGLALTGVPLPVPHALAAWQPRPAADKALRRLHAIAIRTAQVHPLALVNAQAAHGLEQQLVQAMVACMTSASIEAARPSVHRHQGLMNCFEQLMHDHSQEMLSIPEISARLGVSQRLLRGLCVEHLGMSPVRYDRLLRMSRVRSILRRGEREAPGVSDVARSEGFQNLGRFAVHYRIMFGESPSTTLRLGPERGIAKGRPRNDGHSRLD